MMELIHGWSLDSNAREAKERLDQKLRSQRESVIKRLTDDDDAKIESISE